MTAQMRLSADSNLRRTASVVLALAVLFSLAQIVLAPPAPAASCIAGTNKCFRAQFGDIADNTQEVPLTLTNVSSTLTTQQLGAVKITAPYAITSVKSGGVDLPVCPNPIDGSPTCRQGTLPSTTVYVMNLNLAPNASRSLTLGVADPNCTTYTWAIEGRQSNKFQGSLNLMDLSTNSDLTTQVGGCGAPNLGVVFVDQDAATPGTQGDTVDPVTGGYVTAYVIRVVNSGTAAGTGTLNDHTTKGSIVSVDGCVATISGADASCSVTVPAGSSSPDILIQVQAPTVTANDSMQNQASIGASSASEDTSIVPQNQRCTDGSISYDCVRTVLDSRRDLTFSTGAPTSTNQFAMGGFIKGNPSYPTTVVSVVFRETFDTDTCAPLQCTGNQQQGNTLEFGTCPAWASNSAPDGSCKYSVSYNVGLVPDGSLVLARQTARGFWENDAGQNFEVFACNNGTHGSDPKCELSRTITGTDLTNGYITFTIGATAGDGRTGYCAGTVCI